MGKIQYCNCYSILAVLLIFNSFAHGSGKRIISSQTKISIKQKSNLPPTLGWYQIPNTKMRTVCPPNNFGGSTYLFSSFCSAITGAWGGGVMDTKRNRLIVWGGGHNDYYGNEVYALNLNEQSVQRLTDPGLPLWPMDGSYGGSTIANGTQPNSRHTYDSLSYMPNVDKMFVTGGAVSGQNGGFTQDTWTFSFSSLVWEKIFEKSPVNGGVGITATAYDPNTQKVLVHTESAHTTLYSYDPLNKTYQKLGNTEIYLDYHMTGVVDPIKKKFVIVGGGTSANGGVVVYDIGPGSTYQPQRLTTTGGSAIVNSLYPGLAFDPVSGRIIAWNGGDTVYSLNLDTNVWTAITYPGGPGPAQETGTNKRWSYSPESGVFVLVNSMDQNAYTLRLSP